MSEQSTSLRASANGPQDMTPSEAFVETLAANGVTDMFGIMGSAFMDAMDIFAPAGIRLIPVVHEQGAGHMADGYARVSGRHGVVIGQNGPGISNCVTAIAAAYWAHSPVVIVTPEAGTMGIGLGGFQEANQLPMFQEFTKYQGHVTHPARMAEFTARCFDRAQAEMGPTQLNIPRDYFYGKVKVEIPQPRRLDRGAGGEQSLDDAAALIAQAKFPVIISGGGVVMADAIEECKALAERLGAPVVNSYLHNDSFPANHPLWCGPLGYQGSKAAMKLLSRADVVIISEHDVADASVIQDWAARARMLVVTLGERGCDVYRAGEVYHSAAFKAGAEVDPTGAGDVFAAAYLWHLHTSGGDWKTAADWANCVASFVVEKRGVSGAPKLVDVEQRWQNGAGERVSARSEVR